MKFKCHCGEVIADQTDNLSHKGRFVADQDWHDFLDSESPTGGLDRLFARTMYQCRKCGCLYLEEPDRKSLVSFKLEQQKEKDKRILISIRQHLWKRVLTGVWNSSEKSNRMAKGHLHFENCLDEGFEKFEDWTVMETRYYELFEQLRQNETLRLAVLSKDGQTLHTWPKSA